MRFLVVIPWEYSEECFQNLDRRQIRCCQLLRKIRYQMISPIPPSAMLMAGGTR